MPVSSNLERGSDMMNYRNKQLASALRSPSIGGGPVGESSMVGGGGGVDLSTIPTPIVANSPSRRPGVGVSDIGSMIKGGQEIMDMFGGSTPGLSSGLQNALSGGSALTGTGELGSSIAAATGGADAASNIASGASSGAAGGLASGMAGAGMGALAGLAGNAIGGKKYGGALGGAAQGAVTGAQMGGPWGALAGGALGLLLGG